MVAPEGAGFRYVQLQLLKHLGDRVEASGVERLDGNGSLRQLSLRRNDEVQVPEAHVRARDPADAVTSHPRPEVDIEMCKSPYLVCQLLVFQVTTDE